MAQKTKKNKLLRYQRIHQNLTEQQYDYLTDLATWLTTSTIKVCIGLGRLCLRVRGCLITS